MAADTGDTYRPRERSRSPRRGRSRSQGRTTNRRRSYSPRSRSRSREEYRRTSRRSRSPMIKIEAAGVGGSGSAYGGGAPHRSFEERAAAKEQMMSSIRDSSQQDRRVYVGNLAYDVKWHHLKDFMRQSGEVLFADVLLLPNGMSKGCGIVEYATREQAQDAVNTLSNQNLMGRLVYVREDREAEPRFTAPSGGGRVSCDGLPRFTAPSGGGRGGFDGLPGPAGFDGLPIPGGCDGLPGPGGYRGLGGGTLSGDGGGPGGNGRQIYVSNLPYTVGWQDLKDLFRQAARRGAVARADVHVGADGRPKGSGIVAFESPEDARNAIHQFNGYDWQGRSIEVRADRFAGAPAPFGYGGGFGARGAAFGGGGFGGAAFGGGAFGGGGFGRGGFGGGGRGGMRGGFGGGNFGGGGPVNTPRVAPVPNPFTDYATAGTERSEIIYVRNLPWSTSNEDLIELFTTIGKVEQAEIQYESNGRSRGTGVVRFDTVPNAETAITKFSGYQYGGRPLGLSFVKYQSEGANGDAMEGADERKGLTQDQIM